MDQFQLAIPYNAISRIVGPQNGPDKTVVDHDRLVIFNFSNKIEQDIRCIKSVKRITSKISFLQLTFLDLKNATDKSNKFIFRRLTDFRYEICIPPKSA